MLLVPGAAGLEFGVWGLERVSGLMTVPAGWRGRFKADEILAVNGG